MVRVGLSIYYLYYYYFGLVKIYIVERLSVRYGVAGGIWGIWVVGVVGVVGVIGWGNWGSWGSWGCWGSWGNWGGTARRCTSLHRGMCTSGTLPGTGSCRG